MKVFCIGAHKTGTTSIESALSMLGLTVCPTGAWWANPDLQADFYAAQYGPVFDLIDRYDAFQDSPFNHSDFYRVLAHTYPDAHFIMTVRDTDHWVASRRRWRAALIGGILQKNKQLEAAGRLYLLREYGQSDYLNVDEHAERLVYENRNQAVINFFRDTNRELLVLDLEEEPAPWQRLCGFLGRPVPAEDFPHANRTK
jgi:hypothetical protein